jgi:hypothetical protein
MDKLDKYIFLFKRPELLNDEKRFLVNIAYILLVIRTNPKLLLYDPDTDKYGRIKINIKSYLVYKRKLNMNSLDDDIINYISCAVMYKLGYFSLSNTFPTIDEYIDELKTFQSTYDIDIDQIKKYIIEYTQRIMDYIQKLTIVIAFHYINHKNNKPTDDIDIPTMIDDDNYKSHPIFVNMSDNLLESMLLKIGYADLYFISKLQ